MFLQAEVQIHIKVLTLQVTPQQSVPKQVPPPISRKLSLEIRIGC